MTGSEDELLTRAMGGDTEALAELLCRHAPEIRQRIEGRIGRRWQSSLSADDVMQETYIDATRDVVRFAPAGDRSFGKWLEQIAHRNLLDGIRGLRADRRGGDRRRLEHPDDKSYIDILYQITATITSPSGQVARQEHIQQVKNAIANLPEPYRRMIELYDLEGRPIEEVSALTGMRAGTIHMRRMRAYRLLREEIEPI
jgi:RNA polymerase sigma factor (sigma-70 family)